MGEIGAMVARFEQEGLDLDRLIDDELEEAGFLALSSRSTASLSNRADVISGRQNELKNLLKSIEEQLCKIQKEENLPQSVLDPQNTLDEDEGIKHIIIIDDEEEKVKNDFSCQTDLETQSPPVTIATSKTSKNICDKTITTPSCVPQHLKTTSSNPQTKPANSQGMSKVMAPVPVMLKPKTTTPETQAKSLLSPEGVIAYRTLKSPTEAGPASVASMVTLKPSQPTIPPQHLRCTTTPSTPSASATTTIPDTRSSSSKQKDTPAEAAPIITSQPKRPPSPPKFEEGTRIIGKRADDLWYPGEIVKVVTDRSNLVKFRVKFDQGNRGLLRSNHIALESSPPVDVLNVGSRVVALRPRETADEAASWREAKEGPYGKLDVLYAGIVAEICCAKNSNRFLIFFDDGFAQYLPLHKLHHVYHTGDKVWNEVAEHSQEFIQEYLEEFPNRPMVVLKTNQWVKTEWRGKWLKAKVMQVDSSLVKMLFQVDNRSEWIYRGSTRLEPLYRALIDGKISKSKRNKKQRKVSQNPDEPYVDMSLTSPQFGISLYSKTDPKGKKQEESEKNRIRTAKRQQQQQQQPEGSTKGQALSKDSDAVLTTSREARQQTTITISSKKSENNTTQTPSTTTNTDNYTSNKPKTHTLGINTYTQTQKPNVNIPKLNTNKHTIGTNTPYSIANTFPVTNKNTSINNSPKTTGSTTTGSTTTNSTPPANNRLTTSRTNVLSNQERIGIRSTIQPKDSNSWSAPDSTVGIGWSGSSTQHDKNHFSTLSLIDSTASIIQASTMRKRTTAGLANKTNYHRVGTNMVGVGADSTTLMITPSVNNGAMSVMSTVKNNMKWEAPWKRNIHSDSKILKEPHKPVVTNYKHDAATLIQERLQAEKKLVRVVKPSPEIKSLIPKPAILGPHKCGKKCGQIKQVDVKEKPQHNFLSLPLLLNWKREITQRHPRSKKEIYYRSPCNKRLRSIADVGKYLTLTGTSNVTIDQFCFDPEISCVDALINVKNVLLPDISLGKESVSISVINEYDKSCPPLIEYVSDRILSEGVNIVTDPGFLACCDCTDNCQDKSKCSCAQLTVSASAAVDGKEDNTVGYEYRKLMDCVPTGIYECNQNCACSSQCFNRVVQNGIQLRLQVFKTENRGWGLRTLDDIPIGTFICTYSGQIMNEDMANKEGRDFGDEYLAELDHIEVVEKIKEGYESSVTDIEDDSVILQTLDNGTSDGSDNGLVSDSESGSESDSVISDTSISSLYEPVFGDTVAGQQKSHKKDFKNERCSPNDDTVVIKEDGKTFTVTMADENCVVASASNTGSIVLRRISAPSDDKTQDQTTQPNKQHQVQENINSKESGSSFDPPSVICEPTLIDLTSGDEDESTVNQQCDDESTVSERCDQDESTVNERCDQDESTVSQRCDQDESTVSQQCDQDESTVNQQCDQDESTVNQQRDKVESTVNQQRDQDESTVNQQCDQDESTVNQQCDQDESTVNQQCDEDESTVSQQCNEDESTVSQQCDEDESTFSQQCDQDESTVSQQCDQDESTVNQQCDQDESTVNQQCDKVDLTVNQECDQDESIVNQQCDEDESTVSQQCDQDESIVNQQCDQDESTVNQQCDQDESTVNQQCDKVDLTVNQECDEDESIVNQQCDQDESTVNQQCEDKSTVNQQCDEIESVISLQCLEEDDVTNMSQDSSRDIFDLCLDISTESTMSGDQHDILKNEKDNSEQTLTTLKPKDDYLSDSDIRIPSDVIKDGFVGKGLDNDSCHDDSDVNMDSELTKGSNTSLCINDENPDTTKQICVDSKDIFVNNKQDTENTELDIKMTCINENINDQLPKADDNSTVNALQQQTCLQDSQAKVNDLSNPSNVINSDNQSEKNKLGECNDSTLFSKHNSHNQVEGEDIDHSNHRNDESVDQEFKDGHFDQTSDHGKPESHDNKVNKLEDDGDACNLGNKVHEHDEDGDACNHGDELDCSKYKLYMEVEKSDKPVKLVSNRPKPVKPVSPLETKEEQDKPDSNIELLPALNHVTAANHQSSASSDDSVPPLMSADDLSKIAAQLHQPDEEPPKLTKMECGLRLTDLKDTITKLQSRGVALDEAGQESVQDKAPSFEDLPLFPASSNCDLDSFPPSPASSNSDDSSLSDSNDRSSDASFDRKVQGKNNNSGRRARRFIVTLQKNGVKRSASPGMSGESPLKKQTTRSLFNEEHCYVIDAKAYGNCGRYLNHSCSPNLFVQNVFIDTHDLRFPRVAFFAQHNIAAGSELTWDYMYEVGSVQDKVLRCYCGSSQCRGRLL